MDYCEQLALRALLKILSKIPLGGELSDLLRDHQNLKIKIEIVEKSFLATRDRLAEEPGPALLGQKGCRPAAGMP